MTLCAFKGQDLPCVAEAKVDSARHFCGPHEQMLAHDYALKFRRLSKRGGIERARRWATDRGLDVAALQLAADTMTDATKPLTVRTVGDVDAL